MSKSMRIKASCRCGATWTGHRIEHCTACHQTFSGTRSGDSHRVGQHGVDRRCLSVEEMETKGLRRNHLGVWTSGGSSSWLEKKKEARQSP